MHFGQHGLPEAAVDFDYPEEEPQAEKQHTESALTYRMEGFRVCLHWLSSVRTPRAMFLRVQAAKHVFARSNESVTAAAKRLGCTRQHFSEAISEIRKLTLGSEEHATNTGTFSDAGS